MAPCASAAPSRAAPPWRGASRCASLHLKPERCLARSGICWWRSRTFIPSKRIAVWKQAHQQRRTQNST